MRTVFMGTPDFSVPALEALIRGGHSVEAVVTQPDKPKGRGKSMQMPPVKAAALSHGIEVWQPARIRTDAEFMKRLKEINPDVIVVIAFGQILPSEILTLPKYGCINIHASLLPMYRGAAPIQQVILDGRTETGVTTMFMEEGLDTGDMLLKTVVPISAEETGGSLHDKLAEAGGDLILRTLDQLEQGTLQRIPQEGETCYVGMITKETGRIDWTKPAVEIERLVRGLSPWPSAYTKLKGKTLKLWKTKVVSDADAKGKAAPGQIVKVEKDRFLVRTGDGCLAVSELQLEGKKRMETAAFLRGYSLEEGEILG